MSIPSENRGSRRLHELVAAMNPYPCDIEEVHKKAFECAPAVVTKYQKRILGPILESIDIHVKVPWVDIEKLGNDPLGETSASSRACVQAARDIQTGRFSTNGSSDIVCNVDMQVGEIRKFCKLPDEG